MPHRLRLFVLFPVLLAAGLHLVACGTNSAQRLASAQQGTVWAQSVIDDADAKAEQLRPALESLEAQLAGADSATAAKLAELLGEGRSKLADVLAQKKTGEQALEKWRAVIDEVAARSNPSKLDELEAVARGASIVAPVLPAPFGPILGALAGALGMVFGFLQRKQRKGWQAAATETAQGVGMWLAKASSLDKAALKEALKVNQRDQTGRKLIDQVRPVAPQE